MMHSFFEFYQSAINEWPEILSLDLQPQNRNHYTVAGLGRLLEKIEDAHIGSKNEIVFRELHWSIFTIIHSLSSNLQELRPSSIRAEAVERIFQSRLRKAVESKDKGWSADALALAEAYLQEKN